MDVRPALRTIADGGICGQLGQRLLTVREQAHARGAPAEFHQEIDSAAQVLQTAGESVAAEFALRALERYLAFLELQRAIEPVLKRDQVMQAGRSLGGKNKPARLPSPQALADERAHLVAHRGISKGAAHGVLATRYHVTQAAVRKRLRNG